MILDVVAVQDCTADVFLKLAVSKAIQPRVVGFVGVHTRLLLFVVLEAHVSSANRSANKNGALLAQKQKPTGDTANWIVMDAKTGWKGGKRRVMSSCKMHKKEKRRKPGTAVLHVVFWRGWACPWESQEDGVGAGGWATGTPATTFPHQTTTPCIFVKSW